MSEQHDPPVWGAWAKTGRKQLDPHPLICHALDTAAVADQLYQRLVGPSLRARLEEGFAPLGSARRWVATLCGLHDLGKYTPAFQAVAGEVAVRWLGSTVEVDIVHARKDPRVGRRDTPHGVLTAVEMARLLSSWGARSETKEALACALGGHHGSLLAASSVRQASKKRGHLGGARWQRWREEFVAELARLRGLPDPSTLPWDQVVLDVPAVVGLAGLTSVSDWIASDKTNFSYCPLPVEALDGYSVATEERAKRAVNRLGWHPWQPPRTTDFGALFAQPARPIQTVVEELVKDRTRPGVLVVQAPTGEGKTKAALQAAASLVRALDMAGVYVAMPSRATGNQVFDEVTKVKDRLGDGLEPFLLHSSAREDRQRAQTVAARPQDVAVDDDEAVARDAREWFTNKKKQRLLAPVGIGTIDQALWSVIRSWHVFVRLTGLSSKVLVVDEVHNYDAYTSTLLHRLLWWCGRLGMPVILMSATLSAEQREDLIRHWRTGARAEPPSTVPLPTPTRDSWQVTWAEAHKRVPAVPVSVSENNHDHTVRLAYVSEEVNEDIEDVIAWLRQRIGAQGCAAVVRNTLKRAETLHTALKHAVRDWTHPPEVRLLTGGLDPEPRQEVEQWLRKSFGPDTTERPHAIIVGTPALEQSLDIDLDVMVSDFAPMDSLIQRAGRLHRHRRARPRHLGEPELGLTGVAQRQDGPHFASGVPNVYFLDPLLRTHTVLSERTAIKLPSEVPGLIHDVYVATHSAPEATQYRRRWLRAAAQLARSRRRDEGAARMGLLPLLGHDANIRELTEQPAPLKTRKDQPWKHQQQR